MSTPEETAEDRRVFAGLAMAALIGRGEALTDPREVAQWAWRIADAMIDEAEDEVGE